MYTNDERSTIILQEDWIVYPEREGIQREIAIGLLKLFEEARLENRSLVGRNFFGKRLYEKRDFYQNINTALRNVSYEELCSMVAEEKWPQLYYLFSGEDSNAILAWLA